MAYIDAHVHVYAGDDPRYPEYPGAPPRDPIAPKSFTPEDLFAHTRPAGVTRINLIQIRFYHFDNSYLLDAIAQHPDTFAGTAVIDPAAPKIEATMADLGKRGIRAFRIHPRLSKLPPESWLRPDGYRKMFAAARENRQALSCLVDPDGLPEIDRMCASYPDTTIILDHLARVGGDGIIRDAEVNLLCAMARHRSVYCKVGGFYALGKKRPPYTDLAPLIQRVVAAFGPERCMWESDSPFQVQGEHTYTASLDLIRERLPFLTVNDKEWLLGKTAEKVLFTK
jgi:predicted TIM-barrel fold metal-dependent hydrolase